METKEELDYIDANDPHQPYPSSSNPIDFTSTIGRNLLTRDERCQRFGIDCGDSLVWSGATWQPGGEYVKKLTLRNVTNRTLHVKYTLPKTKLFFMEFPVKTALSPGIAMQIEVRFRPIRHEEYDDEIEILCEHGTFTIPVQARLAELKVSLTEEVSFGIVPVNEPTRANIVLTNVGQVDAGFEFEVAPPFLLTPRTGRVDAGQSLTVTVTVIPTDASVLKSIALCKIQGGEQIHPTNLTAQGKYAHVLVTPETLDYGDVLVGSGTDITEKRITVTNTGIVRTTVDVVNVDEDRKQLFTVRPSTALLQPGESTIFSVRFHSSTGGMYSCEHLRFTTPGGNATTVTCSARTIGPIVTIAKKEKVGAPPSKRPLSVQFGDVKVGDSHTHVVTLTNHSKAPALFDLECEDSGVFFFNETKGTIPALLSKSLVVRFCPPVAGNFYRRVPCLILNSSPVYIDLIGTSYDDKHRPNPLRQKHIDAYRLRPVPVKMLAPDRVLEVIQEGREANPHTRNQEAEWSLTHVPASSGDRSRAANTLYDDYFVPLDDKSRPIILSTDLIEYGATNRTQPPPPQKIQITNRTNGKMTVQWIIPPSKAKPGDSSKGIPPEYDFTVTPDNIDIDGGSVAEFKVHFRPCADAYYYFQELEAYVYPKINRSFRLVDEASFTPPYFLSVKCTGHTFKDAQTFSPRVTTSFGGGSLDQTLYVPPAVVGSPVYYTFQLYNSSEVPAAFEFSSDPTNILAVNPSQGMLPVHSFQLITVRFTPRHARTYNVPIDIILNHSVNNTIRINVIGQGGVPRLLLPDNGLVYIKPTCLGVSSTRVVTLRNTSRLPLRYEARVPKQFRNEMKITPAIADVEGNASVDITVTFSPRVTKQYRVEIPIEVYHVTGSETNALMILAAAERNVSVTNMETRLHELALAKEEAELYGNQLNHNPTVPSRPITSSVQPNRPQLLIEDNLLVPPSPVLKGTEQEEKKNEDYYLNDTFQNNKDIDDDDIPYSHPHTYAHRKGAPLQRLQMTVVTEGTSGALTFITPTLDFGSTLVHGTTHIPIFIENKSDCTLLYRLDAIIQIQLSSVDLDTDDSGIVELEEVEKEFENARWNVAHKQDSSHGNDNGNAGEDNSNNDNSSKSNVSPLPSLLSPMGSHIGGSTVNDAIAAATAASEGYGTMPSSQVIITSSSGQSNVPTVSSVPPSRATVPSVPQAQLPPPKPTVPASKPGTVTTVNPPTTASNGKPIDKPVLSIMPPIQTNDPPSVEPFPEMDGEASIHQPHQHPPGHHGIFTRTLSLHANDPRVQFKSRVPGENGKMVPILQFDPPSGVIPAHSRVRADVAFSPAVAGTYRFRIFYETRTENDNMNDEIRLPASALSKAAAMSRAAEAEADPRDPATVDWSAEPQNDNDLFCDATGMGAFPTACIEDIRQLTSREAYIVLFPRHFAGMHNHFAPETSDPHIDPTSMARTGLTGDTHSKHGAQKTKTTMTVTNPPPSSSSTALVPAPAHHDIVLPHIVPKDLWIRPEAYTRHSIVWGSGLPQDKGWGGWKFSLPSESRDPVTYAARVDGPLPVHSASFLDILADNNVAIPSTRGALWRLWTQFSIRDLNRYLATRLTNAEDRYNRATQMTRDPTKLAAFPFEFAPAPLGSPPAVVLLQLRNNGKLPSQINFQFPHERDVDVEPWAEVDEPTRDELNDNELLERRIFDIQPRSLRLLPGQCATIRIHYAYATMINGGRHEVIVMLRLRHGKPIRLMLRGCTLAPKAPYLYSGIPSRITRLAPVPLGLALPPVQTVLISNPSAVPLRFAILPATLRALANVSFGVPVFEVLNHKGYVPAGGEENIRIVFRPVEARTYRVRLDIAYAADDGTNKVEDILDTLIQDSERGIHSRTGHDHPLHPHDGDDDGNQLNSPDVGIGVATGQRGYEVDIEGLLQIRLIAQGYVPTHALLNDNGLHNVALPLIPIPPIAGLGLIPPQPPIDNDPHPLEFESTVILANEKPHNRKVEGALGVANFGSTAAYDALADGVYAISGLDSLSAGVSTFYNPLDIVTGVGGVLDLLSVAKATGEPQLFSGPDALATAAATAKLTRANGLLARLAINEADIMKSTNNPASVNYRSRSDLGSSIVEADNSIVNDTSINTSIDSTDSSPLAYVAFTNNKVRNVRLPRQEDRAMALASLYSLVARLSSVTGLKSLYRPGTYPPLFFSAFPPLRRWTVFPHYDLPEAAAVLSSEWIRFGDVPTAGITHRIFMLRNIRGSNKEDPNGLGPLHFAWDPKHPAIMNELIRIHPMSGIILPGEAVVIRVTMIGPREPQVLTTDIACVISVPVEEQRARAAAMIRQAMVDNGTKSVTDPLDSMNSSTSMTLSRRSTGGRRANNTSNLQAHISVADKSTISRSHRLEQTAREAAMREAYHTAVAERNKGRSVYKTTKSSMVMAGATIVQGQGNPKYGGTNGLYEDPYARLPIEDDRQTVDTASVAVTVGADRAMLAAMRAREQSLQFASNPDGPIALPTSLHDAEVLSRIENQRPVMANSGMDTASLMMRQMVKGDKQGTENIAVTGALGSNELNDASVGAADAETAQFVQKKIAIETDPTTLRRIRIASRAHDRLSPPPSANVLLHHKSGRPVSKTSNHGSKPSTARNSHSQDNDPSAIPLPQAPHAALYLHITARVCSSEEFIQAYSPSHMVAFFYNSAKELLNAAPSLAGVPSKGIDAPVSVSSHGSHKSASLVHDLVGEGAVRDVLSTLLADVVNDPQLTTLVTNLIPNKPSTLHTTLGTGSHEDRTNPQLELLVPSLTNQHNVDDTDKTVLMEPRTLAEERLAIAADLLDGVTFAEVVASNGDSNILASRVASRAASRAASRMSSLFSNRNNHGNVTNEEKKDEGTLPSRPVTVPTVTQPPPSAATKLKGGTDRVSRQQKNSTASLDDEEKKLTEDMSLLIDKENNGLAGPVTVTAEAALDKKPVRTGPFDTSVPPVRPNSHDLDIRDHVEAARALHESECRDFVSRLMEGMVFSMVRECAMNVFDITQPYTSASTHTNYEDNSKKYSLPVGNNPNSNSSYHHPYDNVSPEQSMEFYNEGEIDDLEPEERLRLQQYQRDEPVYRIGGGDDDDEEE